MEAAGGTATRARGMRAGGLLRLLFAVDLRSLALFRIALAGATLYAAAIYAPDLTAFFSDEGVLTRAEQAAHQPFGRASLLMLSGSPWAARAVWAALALAALALLVGWRARAAAFVAWICLLSFVGRNGPIGQGGDVLLPLLLFWATFLPISAVFSVDAALSDEDLRAAPPWLSVATVGALLQALYVYVFGALLKTDPVWHVHGSAVWLAIHLDSFATPLAHWFRQFAALTFPLTLFVFLIELFSPCLLFFPDSRLRVRTATLALLAAMHVGFRLFLNIGHFWLASLASLTLFLPGRVWDFVAARWWTPEQRRIEIWYDRDCGFCRKVALILREFHLPRAAPVRPAQDHPEWGPLLEREVSWVVVDGRGRPRLHWDAVAFVMRQSPLLRPLGWLAALWGATGLGRPTYDLIGRNRGPLGRLTAALRPVPLLPARSRAITALLVLVVVFCFAWNLREHFAWAARSGSGLAGGAATAVPDPLRRAAGALGFTQRWGMFAPYPEVRDGYPAIVARYEGGAALDLFRRPPAPPSAERLAPAEVMPAFSSDRWKKYWNTVAFAPEPRRAALVAGYARLGCAEAARHAPPGARALRLEIGFEAAETVAGGVRRPFRLDLGTHPCP